MGQEQSHLLVYNFNVTKMETFGLHRVIDHRETEALVEVRKCWPTSKILKMSKWEKTDIIIQSVSILSIMQPQSIVLDCSHDETKEDTQYIAAVTAVHNDTKFGCDITSVEYGKTSDGDLKIHDIKEFKDIEDNVSDDDIFSENENQDSFGAQDMDEAFPTSIISDYLDS